MNIEDQSDNLNDNNIEQEDTTAKDNEPTDKTENNQGDFNPFYVHADNSLSLLPDDSPDKSSKNKKRSSTATKDNDALVNNLETILKKLDQLQRDVNQLMERGKNVYGNGNYNEEILRALVPNLPNIISLEDDKDKIQKEGNPTMPSSDIIQEFISMYHSSTVKKSLSINKQLEDKIKKLIEQHYGITGNESKIINTALMIALLKMS